MPLSSLVSDQGGSLLHLFSLSNMPGKQLIKSAITLLKKGLMRKRAPLTREENPSFLVFLLIPSQRNETNLEIQKPIYTPSIKLKKYR